METKDPTALLESQAYITSMGDQVVCDKVGICSVYRSLKQNPSMGVWKMLYCCHRFATCRHYRILMDRKITENTVQADG